MTSFADDVYDDVSRRLGSMGWRGHALLEPEVWQPILLGIHFLCVVHSVWEQKPDLLGLIGKWGALGRQPAMEQVRATRDETQQALNEFEQALAQNVIDPLERHTESARQAIHELLSGEGRSDARAAQEADAIIQALVARIGKIQSEGSQKNS